MTRAGGESAIIDKCRNSLGAYYLATNSKYTYVRFQQEELIPQLERLERGETKRLMLWLPPRHGKTEVGTKTFIPWCLGRHPDWSVILTAYGAELAWDFGNAVKNAILSKVFKAVFPNCQLRADSRASDNFRTSAGGAFFAAGFDGTISGRGADLLVIDDPIKNVEEAHSETRQRHLMEAYRGVIKARLEKSDARVLFISTRWAVRDLAARILEEEGDLWNVFAMKAEPEPGKYLWPERYDEAHYEERKRDPYIWAAEYQQEPITAINQPFKLEWLMPDENGQGGCIYRHPILPGQFNTYMLVDPALSKEKTADRTCILILAAGPEKRIFLVDAVLDRLDPGERSNEILRLARIWEPQQILYEEYGLLSDVYHLKLAMRAQDMQIFPQSIGRKGPRHQMRKQERILELVPDFREGRIWLPPSMKRTLKDGTKFDIVKYFIEEEYLPYAGDGSVAHDDMLDAMSRIHEPELHMEFVQNSIEEEEEYRPRGSWEVW